MKKKTLWSGFLILVASVTSLLYVNMSRPLLTTHVNLYMSPTGSDSNDGLSSKTPIQSLARAHALVAAQLKKKPVDIEINVAAGTYFNQTVKWTAVHKDFYVVIKGSNPLRKPVFDGRLDSKQSLGNQKSFFVLSAQGIFSNLTLENIQVQYYSEGVTFSGNREDANSGFNGNNKILFSVFDRIGSKYHVNQAAPTYAVVRFVNSRFNTVKGNIFSNIDNASRRELLHALYISNNSSYNLVEGNAFRVNGGDPVRVRDFSNFNKILKNEFDRAGSYGYSEWYCEKASSSDCTKAQPECPSWGNEFRDNVLKNVATFSLYVNPSFNMASSACKVPAPAEAKAKRLSTSNNVAGASFLVTSVLNSSHYYGFCSNLNSCVSSAGKCYAEGKGTASFLCSQKVWYSCSSEKDLNQIRSGVRCVANGTSFAWVY